jgi:hypothetical protein
MHHIVTQLFVDTQDATANLEMENAPWQGRILSQLSKHQFVTIAHPPSQDSPPIPHQTNR